MPLKCAKLPPILLASRSSCTNSNNNQQQQHNSFMNCDGGEGAGVRMISADCLAEQLQQSSTESSNLVILDCRPSNEFAQGHIDGAFSAFLPSALLHKRLRTGNLSVSRAIKDSDERQSFCDRISMCNSSVVLVEDKPPIGQSGFGSAVCHGLQNEFGVQSSFLQGGFRAFYEDHPELCVTPCANGNGPLSSNPNSSKLSQLLPLDRLTLTELTKDDLQCSPLSDEAFCSNDSPMNSYDNINYCSSRHKLNQFPVQILPCLYLGNEKNSNDRETLDRYNIRHIINVTPDLPCVFASDQNIRYLQIPVYDDPTQDLARYFPECIKFIDEARQRDEGVLVHCLAGISRSVTIIVAYLIYSLRVSLDEAYDFVKKEKPNISPNLYFMGQLLEWERQQPKQSVANGTSAAGLHQRNHFAHQRHHAGLTVTSSGGYSPDSGRSSSCSSCEDTMAITSTTRSSMVASSSTSSTTSSTFSNNCLF